MRKSILFIITSLLSLIVTSCQDEDFGFSEQDVFKGAYARNFEAKYGKIDPNQSWDLSTYKRTLSAQHSATTRALADIVTLKDGWFEVEKSMIDWVNQKLPDTKNNSSLESFGILMGTGEFAIIPLFEAGATDLDWKLHMVVHDGERISKDEVVWSRNRAEGREDIEVKKGTATCGTCNGFGVKKTSSDDPCLHCGGKGYFPGGTEACPEHCNAGTITVDCSNPDCEDGWDTAIPCTTCKGKGRTGWWIFSSPCTDCGGKKATLFDWSTKDGTGFSKCSTCNGVGTESHNCGTCIKGKVTTCPVCKGTGTGGIKCDACNGYGVTEDVPWRALLTSENTLDAKAIRTKPHYVNTTDAAPGSVVYFYLEINTTKSKYTNSGDKQSSLQNKMKVIQSDKRPANVPEDCGYRFIGVEEQSRGTIDKDYNDLVFLVVGKPLPTVFEFSTSQTTVPISTIKKRYMVEDLGSAVDWDFNDIVIDVAESRTKTITVGSDGNIANSQDSRTAVATIKYLCGTMPLQVVFGDGTNTLQLPRITDPTNEEQSKQEIEDDPDHPVENPTYNVDGTPGCHIELAVDISSSNWTPENNKLSVRVWKKTSTSETETGSSVWMSSFPGNGEVPYIIATDITVNWQDEGNDITSDWWTNNTHNARTN